MTNGSGMNKVDVVKEERILLHNFMFGVGYPRRRIFDVYASDHLVPRNLYVPNKIAALHESVPPAHQYYEIFVAYSVCKVVRIVCTCVQSCQATLFGV
jgi:hypothetical protein